jgi:hypothetical protein
MLALFKKWVSRNPVNRGLLSSAELWRWSSFRPYALGETGPVGVNQWEVLKLKIRAPDGGDELRAGRR